MDFKEGVEFQIYVDPERSENASFTQDLNEAKALPHAKVVSIESDRFLWLECIEICTKRSQPLILFNGTRPTKLNHNRQLMQLSQMSGWLSLAELNKQVIKEPDWLVEETPRVACLGEAMRIGNHIYCGFTQIFLENPTPTKINRYSIIRSQKL